MLNSDNKDFINNLLTLAETQIFPCKTKSLRVKIVT